MIPALVATLALAAAPVACPKGAALTRSASAVYRYLICERPAPDGGAAIREGPMLIFTADGQLSSRLSYLDGEEDGEQLRYDSAGNVVEVQRYRQGKLHGLQERWGDQAVKTLEEEYADGERDGRHREWRPDGTLIVDSQWARGELQRYTTYYPNGHKRSEARSPFPNTTITDFDERGEVTQTVTLVDGLERGFHGTTDSGRLSCPRESFGRVDALGVAYLRERCGGFPQPSADGKRTETYAWVPRKAMPALAKLGCTFQLMRTSEDEARQWWQTYFAQRAEPAD